MLDAMNECCSWLDDTYRFQVKWGSLLPSTHMQQMLKVYVGKNVGNHPVQWNPDFGYGFNNQLLESALPCCCMLLLMTCLSQLSSFPRRNRPKTCLSEVIFGISPPMAPVLFHPSWISLCFWSWSGFPVPWIPKCQLSDLTMGSMGSETSCGFQPAFKIL